MLHLYNVFKSQLVIINNFFENEYLVSTITVENIFLWLNKDLSTSLNIY